MVDVRFTPVNRYEGSAAPRSWTGETAAITINPGAGEIEDRDFVSGSSKLVYKPSSGRLDAARGLITLRDNSDAHDSGVPLRHLGSERVGRRLPVSSIVNPGLMRSAASHCRAVESAVSATNTCMPETMPRASDPVITHVSPAASGRSPSWAGACRVPQRSFHDRSSICVRIAASVPGEMFPVLV